MPGKMDSRARSNSPESPNAVLVCGFGTETIGSISFLCFAVVQWPPLTNSYICAFCRALGAIRRRLILSGSRQSSYNWPECAKPSPYFHTIILPIDPIVSSSSSPSPYRYISTQLSIIILLPIIIIHPSYFFVDIIVAFIIINQNSCKFDLLSVIQQLYPLFIKFSIFNNASFARRFQNITIKCSLIGTIDEFQSKRCFSKYFATFIFKGEIFC